MNIPRVIWQTYKSNDIPAPAQPGVDSWTRANPKWAYNFLDDAEIDAFVAENCTPREYETFRRLPLGAMKADFWRYVVLYTHGGVYADIDTTSEQPIERWVGSASNIVTGVENDPTDWFCQWVIAAAPGHDILRWAIDKMVERCAGEIDLSDPEAIYYYTGPLLWTDAVRHYLGRLAGRDIAALDAQTILDTPSLWSGSDVLIHPWPVLSKDAVRHHFAASKWKAVPGYPSWRELRKTHVQAR